MWLLVENTPAAGPYDCQPEAVKTTMMLVRAMILWGSQMWSLRAMLAIEEAAHLGGAVLPLPEVALRRSEEVA